MRVSLADINGRNASGVPFPWLATCPSWHGEDESDVRLTLVVRLVHTLSTIYANFLNKILLQGNG